MHYFVFISICATKIGRFLLHYKAEMLQRYVFRFVDDFFVSWINGLLYDFLVLIFTAVSILYRAQTKNELISIFEYYSICADTYGQTVGHIRIEIA